MPLDAPSIREDGDMAVSKLRSVRIDERLWDEAKRIATERRETPSAIMKRALVEYVEQHGGTVAGSDEEES